MIKQLASAAKPAMAFLFLPLAAMASPGAAQVATIAATPSATAAVRVAVPAATAATSAAAPTAGVNLPSANIPGRAAVLSPAPRPVTGISPPAGTVSVRPAVSHASLWPLVYANQTGAALNEQEECVAVAVYHEARGEPFDGQLAVAEVIMNRAVSGRYPATWCEVVKQPWQFSFVRGGRFPSVDRNSASWAYAQAITRIAARNLADAVPNDVLWYHADYVAPSWGRRLSRVEKIGAHIFYRAV